LRLRGSAVPRIPATPPLPRGTAPQRPDSRSSVIDAQPSVIDARPLVIEAQRSVIDARWLVVEAPPSVIEARWLDIDAATSDIDAQAPVIEPAPPARQDARCAAILAQIPRHAILRGRSVY
jgi:hypothetical protein